MVNHRISLLRHARVARRVSKPHKTGTSRAMISIAAVQRTAEALMSKAAIEIPDDYLDGLRRAGMPAE